MSDSNRKQIDEHTREARGGDERDSQGDGVADAAAMRDRTEGAREAGDDPEYSQPGTNREAVPGGIEGSIMEDEESGGRRKDSRRTGDKAQGDERRVDDL